MLEIQEIEVGGGGGSEFVVLDFLKCIWTFQKYGKKDFFKKTKRTESEPPAVFPSPRGSSLKLKGINHF